MSYLGGDKKIHLRKCHLSYEAHHDEFKCCHQEKDEK